MGSKYLVEAFYAIAQQNIHRPKPFEKKICTSMRVL